MLKSVVAFCLATLVWHEGFTNSEEPRTEQQRRQEELRGAGSQIVTLEGHRYRFPAYASVRHFRDQDTTAVEVGLRSSFWAKIFEAVGPVPGWVSAESDGLGAHYITKPNELFQWRLERAAPLPPVRGPVELYAHKDGMRFWWSRDPEIVQEGLLYVTFDGRSDLYGQCTDQDVGDETRSCAVFWLDRGVMHNLWVPGTLIRSAPAVADEYKRLVWVG